MIQTLGMVLAAALLFAIATGSANAQRPWTVTHDSNTTSQKKPGALKAKNSWGKAFEGWAEFEVKKLGLRFQLASHEN